MPTLEAVARLYSRIHDLEQQLQDARQERDEDALRLNDVYDKLAAAEAALDAANRRAEENAALAALADQIGVAGYRHARLWWDGWFADYDALSNPDSSEAKEG